MPLSLNIKRWELPALLALALLVSALVYSGLTAAPILDDLVQIEYINSIDSPAQLWGRDCYGFFRPVKNLLYFLADPRSGEGQISAHLVGLGAFLFATLCVFAFARRITGDRVIAILTAAIWALTPTIVSTIIWLSCANISISVGFLCLALIFYDRAKESKTEANSKIYIANLLGAGGAAFVALLSYETSIVVVPIALLIDWVRQRKILSRTVVLPQVALVAVVGIYLLIRHANVGEIAAQNNQAIGPELEKWQLFAAAPWLFLRHLVMWLQPVGNVEIMGTFVWMKTASVTQMVVAWVIWAGFIIIPLVIRTRLPIVALGLGFFVIGLFPSGNFIPVWAGPIADYYLTLPSVGLALLAAWLLATAIKELRKDEQSRRLLWVLVILILGLSRLIYIVFVPLYAKSWQNPLELYSHAIESRPLQFQARAILARELYKRGEYDLAIQNAKVASEQGPWQAGTWALLGDCWIAKGDAEKAVINYEQALTRTKETEVDMISYLHFSIGKAKGQSSETRGTAMNHFRLVLSLPQTESQPFAAFQLARLYQIEGDSKRAESTIVRALGLFPNHPLLSKALNVLQDQDGDNNLDTILQDESGGYSNDR